MKISTRFCIDALKDTCQKQSKSRKRMTFFEDIAEDVVKLNLKSLGDMGYFR